MSEEDSDSSVLELEYLCERCNKTFPKEYMFIRHLSAVVPCDFWCDRCGRKQISRDAYYSHKKRECKPRQITVQKEENDENNDEEQNSWTDSE